jgi:hypothetical protein
MEIRMNNETGLKKKKKLDYNIVMSIRPLIKTDVKKFNKKSTEKYIFVIYINNIIT